MDPYRELLETGNLAIADMAMKCESVLSGHDKALVSISGGADSDVMLDLCERVRTVTDCHVDYVFYDTGLEYRATKEHIGFLEDNYGVSIRRQRAVKTIPVCAREYGQPFVSKMVAHHMGTLQRHDFGWDDATLPILKLRYPSAPESSLKWWCNSYQKTHGAYNSYCVNYNRWLGEFIIDNPPWFKVSSKCCTYAKKRTKEALLREGDWTVELVGVRRAEGGVRSLSSTCFIRGGAYKGVDAYRPLFWMSSDDMAAYCETFGIVHSDCYERWGFKRTGCVGCPFNRVVFDDLAMAEVFEPNLVRAARKVFADSYEYTRMYREYRERRKAEEHGQLSLDFSGGNGDG